MKKNLKLLNEWYIVTTYHDGDTLRIIKDNLGSAPNRLVLDLEFEPEDQANLRVSEDTIDIDFWINDGSDNTNVSMPANGFYSPQIEDLHQLDQIVMLEKLLKLHPDLSKV